MGNVTWTKIKTLQTNAKFAWLRPPVISGHEAKVKTIVKMIPTGEVLM